MTSVEQTRPPAVTILIVLQVLLGVSALAGGAVFIIAPDGSLIHFPLRALRFSPFHDFLVPGIILFILLGVYPLLVAYGLWRRPGWRWPNALNPFPREHWSWAGSLAAGAVVMIWIAVQVAMLRSIGFLHVLYFVWGFALVLLSLAPRVRRHYGDV